MRRFLSYLILLFTVWRDYEEPFSHLHLFWDQWNWKGNGTQSLREWGEKRYNIHGGVKWEGNTIIWESPGYRVNLPVSHMVHQISCVKGMNKLLKIMLHCRLTLYPQIYPNQTNIGFSNLSYHFLQHFHATTSRQTLKHNHLCNLGREIHFIGVGGEPFFKVGGRGGAELMLW